MGDELKGITTPEAFATAFAVSRETLGRLTLYVELLERWSKVQDLVAPGTMAQVWHRHVADSAQLVALAPAAAHTWLDLGSGAGFPGLVVAIMSADRPGFKMHLAESNARKCAFLRDVARQTGAPVEIHNDRIESLRIGHNGADIGVVCARALAPLGKLLQLARPFFSAGTAGLFLKGREVEAEIAEARKAWRFEATLHPSLTEPSGRVIELTALDDLEKGE